MFSLLPSVAENLQWTDILDVVVVTFILYGVISWIRRSASSNMVIACLGFGILYVVSRALELYLTRWLLQAILAVAVLAVVIVFQDDIRRLLDRLGTWPWIRPARKEGADALVDTLVGAAECFSGSRTGALIAIRGEDPWARLIRGGILIDAVVSRPLLESIFDHHSAGHDGAVLIEGGRMTRFATHLPLSSNHEALGGHGTRHAAALGLCEASDALVLVVSEETGSISLAEGGRLAKTDSTTALRARLIDFCAKSDRDTAHGSRAWWRSARVQNGFLAIVVALGLWIGFARQTDAAVRTMTVPIELRGLSPSLAVVQASNKEAEITLEGPTRAFDLLDDGDLAVVVNLDKLKAGAHVFKLTQDNVELPGAISLARVQPSAIRVVVRPAEPPADG